MEVIQKEETNNGGKQLLETNDIMSEKIRLTQEKEQKIIFNAD